MMISFTNSDLHLERIIESILRVSKGHHGKITASRRLKLSAEVSLPEVNITKKADMSRREERTITLSKWWRKKPPDTVPAEISMSNGNLSENLRLQNTIRSGKRPCHLVQRKLVAVEDENETLHPQSRLRGKHHTLSAQQVTKISLWSLKDMSIDQRRVKNQRRIAEDKSLLIVSHLIVSKPFNSQRKKLRDTIMRIGPELSWSLRESP